MYGNTGQIFVCVLLLLHSYFMLATLTAVAWNICQDVWVYECYQTRTMVGRLRMFVEILSHNSWWDRWFQNYAFPFCSGSESSSHDRCISQRCKQKATVRMGYIKIPLVNAHQTSVTGPQPVSRTSCRWNPRNRWALTYQETWKLAQ
jgi:hypothetical protein